jgi:hypothetical protein
MPRPNGNRMTPIVRRGREGRPAFARRALSSGVVLLWCLGLATGRPVRAQATVDTASRAVAPLVRPAGPRLATAQGPRPDSLKPPLSPGRAFLYSFALPGLGQGRLQHHAAGAIYFTVEAVAIAMLTKTGNDLRIARAHLNDHVINSWQTDPSTGAPIQNADGGFIVADTLDTHYGATLEKARRTHYEDWIAVLIFNHLFAGADAFVSSLLWDLPAEVQYQVTPQGPAVGLRIRW